MLKKINCCYISCIPLLIMSNKCLIKSIKKKWDQANIISGDCMDKEINKIINSMDVKQDSEDAESKALTIVNFGPDALDFLVELGNIENEKESDAVRKKRILRAIIFTLLVFTQKKESASLKKLIILKAKDLLSKLSSQGYESARRLLQNLGFNDSDIQKEHLLSLPIVEKHIHDKEISLNEALLEIKIGKTFSGFKGLKDDCYMIGLEGKYYHKIYRIEKNLFALRSLKVSKKQF